MVWFLLAFQSGPFQTWCKIKYPECLLLRKKKFHIVYNGLKCAETNLASLCFWQRQLIVVLLCLPIVNIKKVEI